MGYNARNDEIRDSPHTEDGSVSGGVGSRPTVRRRHQPFAKAGLARQLCDTDQIPAFAPLEDRCPAALDGD